MTYRLPDRTPWQMIGIGAVTVGLVALSVYLAALAPCSWLCSFGIASVPARCIRACMEAP